MNPSIFVWHSSGVIISKLVENLYINMGSQNSNNRGLLTLNPKNSESISFYCRMSEGLVFYNVRNNSFQRLIKHEIMSDRYPGFHLFIRLEIAAPQFRSRRESVAGCVAQMAAGHAHFVI